MKKYIGGCHCGKVSYEVELDLTSGAMSCNCSICSKKGHLLAFAPLEQFKLLKGEKETTDYQFNTMNIHHLFCKTCGISSYGHGSNRQGEPMVCINARCLEGVDIDTLKVTKVDGKSF